MPSEAAQPPLSPAVHDPHALEWSDVTLTAPNGRRLLDQTSGRLSSGRLVALMGPSGAGKTSLLNALAGRIPGTQTLTGAIRLGGQPRNPAAWSHTVAYVPQRFHTHEWQTVEETLCFAATASLGHTAAARACAEQQLKALGLLHVRSTYVIHLSGGERVRLGVGIEMLGDPAILFLDEPTSGLDSAAAMRLLTRLHALTASGKTIVVSIHQPSYKMLQHFDDILLISAGQTAYIGPVDGCLRFFSECGFELPANTNPADFFLETIAGDAGVAENIRQEWRFRQECVSTAPLAEHRTAPLTEMSGPATAPAHSGQPFSALLARELTNVARNVSAVRARLVYRLVVCFIHCASFFQVGIENADVHSIRGVFAFTLFNLYFSAITTIIGRFAHEKKILERERMSGLYSGSVAYAAMLASELLMCAAYDLPYMVAVYLAVGLPLEMARVCGVFAAQCALVVFTSAYSLTMSILVGEGAAAQWVGSTANVLVTLFSGAYSNPQTMPAMIRWVGYLSPISYAFRAVLQAQLRGKTVRGVAGAEVLRDFGLDGPSVAVCVAVILLGAAGMAGAGAWLLERRTRSNLRISQAVGKRVA